ncbi:MAG: DUF418 domain-containing protein, partial [Trueperaceae bacterium]
SLSLLFGLGFALQLRRNPNALGRFSVRLVVLLMFGLVHGFLIWNGDILTEYALVGFLLIPFANRSSLTVVLWALGIFLCFPLTAAIYNALSLDLDRYSIAQSFQYGGYREFLRTNILVYTDRLVISILYIAQTISCFLLGLWLGRVGALERPQRHRLFIVLVCVFVLVLHVWGYRRNLADYNFRFDHFFVSPTLGFAYIFALAFFVSFLPFQKLFYIFSYTGRMPLTTYMTASVVLGYLFFGYGLGWYGRFTRGEWLLIAVLFYTAQIVLSHLWLRFFRVGPLEWLWRSLSYGKLQKIRRDRDPYSSVPGVPALLEPEVTPPVEIPKRAEFEEPFDWKKSTDEPQP